MNKRCASGRHRHAPSPTLHPPSARRSVRRPWVPHSQWVLGEKANREIDYDAACRLKPQRPWRGMWTRDPHGQQPPRQTHPDPLSNAQTPPSPPRRLPQASPRQLAKATLEPLGPPGLIARAPHLQLTSWGRPAHFSVLVVPIPKVRLLQRIGSKATDLHPLRALPARTRNAGVSRVVV